MKKLRDVMIGADIEVFLLHRDQNEIVSAEGLIPGTKHEPYNFDPSNKYFATSLDNVLAEFCIPPVTDRAAFMANIMKSLGYINSLVEDKGLCTVARPAAILDERYLQTENAKRFGCEPDFNVWLQSVNPAPKAADSCLRSAGGHIHIGHGEPSDVALNEAVIKAMDLCIGVPSVLQEPDNKRKELYGKAGAFRFKDYGVEYRTVSNYYAGDERLTNWVFDAIMRGVDLVNDDFPFDDYKDRIVDAINNNNKVVAQTLINELDLVMA